MLMPPFYFPVPPSGMPFLPRPFPDKLASGTVWKNFAFSSNAGLPAAPPLPLKIAFDGSEAVPTLVVLALAPPPALQLQLALAPPPALQLQLQNSHTRLAAKSPFTFTPALEPAAARSCGTNAYAVLPFFS